MNPVFTKPALNLLGVTLNDRWVVSKYLPKDPEASGGYFSESYIVTDKNGKNAFLKALDFSTALNQPQWSVELDYMNQGYQYERDLLELCKGNNLDRISVAIETGEWRDVNSPFAFLPVPYFIFELAQGDIRRHEIMQSFDLAYALRCCHHTATGISQLHRHEIAHQDLKPSNILVFADDSYKVADLGRAVDKQQRSPFRDHKIAGDKNYAPPELLYGYYSGNWEKDRQGCDLYQLGNMVVFLFTRASFNSLLYSEIDVSLRPRFFQGTYSGTFSNVLPHLLEAHNKVCEDLENTFRRYIPNKVTNEIARVIQNLCMPDPSRRGHPDNFAENNQYGLSRYVSLFDRLAVAAEFKLKHLLE